MDTENQQTGQLQAVGNKELQITKDISLDLHQAGKWGKFLAIVGFVFTGFMLLIGIIMSFVMAFLPAGQNKMMPFPPFLLGVFYLILAAVYFFPILYLYRFSAGIRQALLGNNQEKLSVAFANLKAHYRFIGILTIVMLCFYPIFIVLMFVVGFSSTGGFPGIGV